MIPLMMQRQYKPKGWLGLIMGTRLCVVRQCLHTANCIIIDHFSAFESGLVAPFLYAAG
jgi:hypothetical protein